MTIIAQIYSQYKTENVKSRKKPLLANQDVPQTWETKIFGFSCNFDLNSFLSSLLLVFSGWKRDSKEDGVTSLVLATWFIRPSCLSKVTHSSVNQRKFTRLSGGRPHPSAHLSPSVSVLSPRYHKHGKHKEWKGTDMVSKYATSSPQSCCRLTPPPT